MIKSFFNPKEGAVLAAGPSLWLPLEFHRTKRRHVEWLRSVPTSFPDTGTPGRGRGCEDSMVFGARLGWFMWVLPLPYWLRAAGQGGKPSVCPSRSSVAGMSALSTHRVGVGLNAELVSRWSPSVLAVLFSLPSPVRHCRKVSASRGSQQRHLWQG